MIEYETNQLNNFIKEDSNKDLIMKKDNELLIKQLYQLKKEIEKTLKEEIKKHKMLQHEINILKNNRWYRFGQMSRKEKVFTIIVNDLIEGGFDDVYSTNLRVYPNPFDESTTILFNNPESDIYTLYITDLSGKLCRIVNDITTSEFVLERGDLEQGIYFLELRGPRIYKGKIVIE